MISPVFQSVILASGNAHKAQELSEMGRNQDLVIRPAPVQPLEPILETGLTFLENALIKARAFSELNPGVWVLSDDSGLVVKALNGAPGIYSARYAGEHATDAEHNDKLQHALRHTPDEQRQAEFVCVLVLLSHPKDPLPFVAIGTWRGSIIRDLRGSSGFGYDPLFWVPEQGCTAAELPPPLKNQLSHRAQALRHLIDQLQ